jgi:hypothetical protein
MAVMQCPHCGAEEFTMEGWEDLDHCSSCGKPLGEPIKDPRDPTGHAAGAVTGRPGPGSRKGQSAQKPRRT